MESLVLICHLYKLPDSQFRCHTEGLVREDSGDEQARVGKLRRKKIVKDLLCFGGRQVTTIDSILCRYGFSHIVTKRLQAAESSSGPIGLEYLKFFSSCLLKSLVVTAAHNRHITG